MMRTRQMLRGLEKTKMYLFRESLIIVSELMTIELISIIRKL